MNIKRFLIGGTAGAVLVGLAIVPAIANDWPVNHTSVGTNGDKNARVFNPENELSTSKCTNTVTGKPVINVTQKVQNDPDSSITGNWAFDYFARHITVWKTTVADTYCAIVIYDGNFYAVPGQLGPESPVGGDAITTSTNAPVNGPFSGGERATITNATLLATPTWTTNGNVGTFNYKGDLNGNKPGSVVWQDQYFTSGYTSNDDWWGWKYDGGSHGTWINAISGNSGNIL